jgi:hypothetical protein
MVRMTLPFFDTSCFEYAVTIAVPTNFGVKTPESLMLPISWGSTNQSIEESKLPVPLTVGVQVEV